jgi:adenylate kinase
MHAKAKTVVILGYQASGKGTQAKLLVERYGFAHIEVGGILRAKGQENSPEGRSIAETLKSGALVPFEIAMRLVREKLEALPQETPVLFDGTPRRMDEVRYWEKAMPEVGRTFTDVFFIELDEKKAIARIAKRRTCAKCGTPFTLGTDLREGETACPKCGGEIVQREDETPEAVAKRLTWSKEQTGPVVEHYENLGVLQRINGDQSIEDVQRDIVAALGFA